MGSPYYYPVTTASRRESSQSSQWIPSASFYNGYQTPINLPVTHSRAESVIYSQYQTPSQAQIYPTIQSNTLVASLKLPSRRVRPEFSLSHQSHASNDFEDEFLFHEQQLNRNLTQHGFQRLPVKGDGNCLFYALAEGLIYEMNKDPDEFAFFIRQTLHLSGNFRLTEFSDRLRQLCVEQWRQYEDYYSQFVDQEKVNFLKEVKKFSKNGVSESILGDIVPLTIANALNIHITIFTSVIDLPRIDVKSEYRTRSRSIHRKTIYLAYNQYGLGHYDAAHSY